MKLLTIHYISRKQPLDIPTPVTQLNYFIFIKRQGEMACLSIGIKLSFVFWTCRGNAGCLLTGPDFINGLLSYAGAMRLFLLDLDADGTPKVPKNVFYKHFEMEPANWSPFTSCTVIHATDFPDPMDKKKKTRKLFVNKFPDDNSKLRKEICAIWGTQKLHKRPKRWRETTS
ncbi:unnamed protein product [Nezara viridula]|uniref:Uncharacterized protein n=1 Tax=Nezara viridula TaxID=85310 RepID=A0A9P0H526_NEZVI|nr:unnamed protein product [Nezara viridula]